MTRLTGLAMIGAVFFAATAGCGYPDFQFGTGGFGGAASSSTSTSSSAGGGGATTSTTSSSTTSSTTSSTSTTSTTSTGSGGAPCAIDHLMISEIRTRGLGGGDDEFVELYNPTSSPVALDGLWTLIGRKADIVAFSSIRWMGKGDVIPAKGHFLITGSAYTQSPPGDNTLTQAITDAASLSLEHNGSRVDSVCFYYDGLTIAYFDNPVAPYPCEGTPVFNPHDDSTGTNVDKSLERKPGGAFGNCTDDDDNSLDFTISKPSPENSMSPKPPG